MNEEQAIAICQRRRRHLELEPDMTLEGAERAIVEHKRFRRWPGSARDRLAWLVTFSSDTCRTTIQVDDQTGRILEVRNNV